MLRPILAVYILALACKRYSPPTSSVGIGAFGSVPSSAASASILSADAFAPVPPDAAAAAQFDADGNDDASEQTTGPLPASFHFERVGRSPLALQRICDLTVLGDRLYAAHANQPLGTDGATITVYRPDDAKPFAVAFDWNRPGEPTRGGGAGQGFLRVHAIGGRLFVPDTDPPYAGFGIVDHGTEGYVFVSDERGAFASARMPGHRPPSAPSLGDGGDVGAGAGIVPRAYHVLDVIRFRGRYYASTGSVPPSERAWHGASPGALHVSDARLEPWARWRYEVDYPWPWRDGVWRLTYLVRFRDNLYAGIADYDGRDPNDYVVFAPPPEATAITHEFERAVRITAQGGALTLRWYADAGRLWWIALERDGAAVLRFTRNGDTWTEVPLPTEAGRPTDLTRFKGALVALTEQGLWRIDTEPPAELARVTEKRSPFAMSDAFCAAPIAVFRGSLYAGSQRDGSLWRIAFGP
jgi:hypothetical protein